MDWNKIGFIKASKLRTNIVFALGKHNLTPKELKIQLGYYITHVSSTLKELSDKKLVKCLNPELRKGRIYTLTEVGKEIYVYLNSQNQNATLKKLG